MLEIIAPTLWATFAAYAVWYLTAAKDYVPLTRREAEILWKIHRQNANCNAKKWHVVRHKGKIIGFKCECGYKHVQKRPITISQPKLS
jgi:hypothetical protein